MNFLNPPKQLIGLEKVIVEAGHMYVHQQPGNQQFNEAKYGGHLADLLTFWGLDVQKWLLVDDYNPFLDGHPPVLDIHLYKQQLAFHNFEPVTLFYESEFVKPATQFLEQLLTSNDAREINGKFTTCKGDVKLLDEDGRFSCQFLDACFYAKKLESSDSCYTIISEKFGAKQKNAKKILKLLGFQTNKIHVEYWPVPYRDPISTFVHAQMFRG